MSRPSFSFDDFKSWLEKEDTIEEHFEEDVHVKPKINPRKLLNKIDVESGDIEDIIKEFKNGGKVVDQEGRKLLIEVKSGSFFINKSYVEEIT